MKSVEIIEKALEYSSAPLVSAGLKARLGSRLGSTQLGSAQSSSLGSRLDDSGRLSSRSGSAGDLDHRSSELGQLDSAWIGSARSAHLWS